MRYNLYCQLPKNRQKAIFGTLSADKDGAYLFGDDIVTAVLKSPEIVFISQDGIMLRGYEPDGYDHTGREKFRYQEWFCKYVE